MSAIDDFHLSESKPDRPDPLSEAAPSDCVFCDLIREGDKAPNDWVEAGPGYRVFAPLNPVTKGHLLVVPTEHVRDALDDPRTTAFIMGAAATVANANRIGACNFITSVGREATQSIRHLHVHIVPRRENDGLMLPWSDCDALRAELTTTQQRLDQLTHELHQARTACVERAELAQTNGAWGNKLYDELATTRQERDALAALKKLDFRRILDVLLAVLNGDRYPVNDETRPHLETIVETIDAALETGWTGYGYTEWMPGTGPEAEIERLKGAASE
jgi:histidine triad (HIT) family protein